MKRSQSASAKHPARCRALVILIAISAIAFSPASSAQVRVLPTEIKDDRAPSSSFAGLEIELKVFGDILSDAKAIRLSINTAIDETGKSIIKEAETLAGFNELSESDQNVAKVVLKLKNPARQAMTIKEITGSFEFFVPAKDPASSISLTNISKLIGTAINSPALKAAGVEVILWSKAQFDARKKIEEEKLKKAQAKAKQMKTEDEVAKALVEIFGSLFSSLANMDEEDVALQITDPQSKIVAIEFSDSNGNSISSGRMSMGSAKEQTRVYDFQEKLPADARMNIYVLTAKSLVKAPFKLNDVPLP